MKYRPALLLALLAVTATGCTDRHATLEARHAQWLAEGHQHEATAYHAFLLEHGAADVVPLHQLLRSGRRWKSCGHDEFDVPPREMWDAMAPTLRLVATLQSEGLLEGAVAASGYRDPGFNQCEGGSSRSRHMLNSALDFDTVPATQQAALCDWWKAHGQRHGFGLGFYSQDRIHVDTAGYRTWGRDYTRDSSPCA